MQTEGEPSGLVVDAHGHAANFLPGWARLIYRWVLRRTIPAPASVGDLGAAGVHGMVLSAVGDPIVTRLYARPGFAATRAQLRRIRVAAHAAGAAVVTSVVELEAAATAGTPAVILGIEGADSVGKNLARLDRLHAEGVRVVVPVHLGNNRIGTTSKPWQAYLKRMPFRSHRVAGLTDFGRRFITRMNALGMVVDVAHADAETLRDMVATSSAPVIASHTGARSLSDFDRFLSDEQIRAVAATGGVVGLWPYHYGGEGVETMEALMRHARHVADLVGAAHLCVGTDVNGVPGVMAGAGTAHDVADIGSALRGAGFSGDEVRGILGENFLRVLRDVEATGRALG